MTSSPLLFRSTSRGTRSDVITNAASGVHADPTPSGKPRAPHPGKPLLALPSPRPLQENKNTNANSVQSPPPRQEITPPKITGLDLLPRQLVRPLPHPFVQEYNISDAACRSQARLARCRRDFQGAAALRPPEAASAVLGVLQVKIELGPAGPLVSPSLGKEGPSGGLAGWEKKSATARDQRRLVACRGCRLQAL